MTEKLEFSGYEVVIDPENLRFSEMNLTDYIQKEGSLYDYYGARLALAERNLQNKENLYDKIFNERFIESKERGAAVALAEAKAKSDPLVCALKDEIVEAKYIVNRLKNHLRAWDKNHDNAQSMGHMQRKLMDKLKDHFDGPCTFEQINAMSQCSWDVQTKVENLVAKDDI
jgi:hypothetical protein